MKLVQKSLISAAVSAAIMAPIAAQAEATLYGRIHQTLALVDTDEAGSESTTDINDGGSRFGIKASSNLGNGLTASAHYEYAAETDKATTIGDLRIGTVGLAGAFGEVTVGNQPSAFDEKLGGIFDPTWYVGGVPSGHDAGALGRTANTIQYTNSFGAVDLNVDLRLDDADDGDGEGFGVGVSFYPIDDLTVSVVFDTSQDRPLRTGSPLSLVNVLPGQAGSKIAADGTISVTSAGDLMTLESDLETALAVDPNVAADVTAARTALTEARAANQLDAINKEVEANGGIDIERTGVGAKYDYGRFYGILGWHAITQGDDERTQLQAFGGMNITDSTSAIVGYGVIESDAHDSKPSQIMVGVYHSVGGGLSLHYEGASENQDDSGAPEKTTHTVGMLYRF